MVNNRQFRKCSLRFIESCVVKTGFSLDNTYHYAGLTEGAHSEIIGFFADPWRRIHAR